jgi:hypothetical protein
VTRIDLIARRDVAALGARDVRAMSAGVYCLSATELKIATILDRRPRFT